MQTSKCQKITRFCRNFTRWILLIISILIFVFALLSSASGFGGELRCIIKNSPNALSWLLLLIINWIVWKSELVGSILLIVFAIATGFFFGGFSDNLFVLFVITIPLLILAILLILYHFCQLKQRKLSL